MPDAASKFLDPRVTAVASWALSLAATVAMSVGAWFFNDLKHGIADLTAATMALKVQIAVLEVNASRAGLVEGRVAVLEAQQARNSANIESIQKQADRVGPR